MTLIGFAVIRGNKVLAYYGESEQEKEIIKMANSYSGKTEQRLTAHYLYSFLSSATLTYACVVPANSDKGKPLELLDTVSRRWAATISQKATTADTHTLNRDLSDNFGSLFEEYNNPNKAAQVRQKLEQTEEIMKDNIEKAMIRGVHLDDIDDRSQNLLSTSEEFVNQATNLKWTMRCSYYKSLAIKVLISLVILYIILSIICGGFSLKPRCITDATKESGN